jgi:hypothetical protein
VKLECVREISAYDLNSDRFIHRLDVVWLTKRGTPKQNGVTFYGQATKRKTEKARKAALAELLRSVSAKGGVAVSGVLKIGHGGLEGRFL